MINYEEGRAYALSSISQDILHDAKQFQEWANGLIMAMKKPVESVIAPMETVTIYTDGACSGNPGPGGWGAILILGKYIKEISGCAQDTTNNRMELSAAINALSALKRKCSVMLYSDSAYLVNAFTNGWIQSWSQNGWLKADKKPVENQDLWEKLFELTSNHNVTFVKVKGHAGNQWNNRCDELAVAAYQKAGE